MADEGYARTPVEWHWQQYRSSWTKKPVPVPFHLPEVPYGLKCRGILVILCSCCQQVSVSHTWLEQMSNSVTGRYISLFSCLQRRIRCSRASWLVTGNCFVILKCKLWLKLEVSVSTFKVRIKNDCHSFTVLLLAGNSHGTFQTHAGTLTVCQRLRPHYNSPWQDPC